MVGLLLLVPIVLPPQSIFLQPFPNETLREFCEVQLQHRGVKAERRAWERLLAPSEDIDSWGKGRSERNVEVEVSKTNAKILSTVSSLRCRDGSVMMLVTSHRLNILNNVPAQQVAGILAQTQVATGRHALSTIMERPSCHFFILPNQGVTRKYTL